MLVSCWGNSRVGGLAGSGAGPGLGYAGVGRMVLPESLKGEGVCKVRESM